MPSYDLETTSDGIQEKLIGVKRTSKVVKGGRDFGFAALVAVGDTKGRFSVATGKAREVPAAIDKALKSARRSMKKIELAGANTIQHQIIGKHGSTKVIMIPAEEGTGVIAGAAMRAICEVSGIQNIVTKVIGSSNPVNVVRAAIDGLLKMSSPEQIAEKRNKTVQEILG